MELIADLTLVLVAALAGGFVAQRLRQPLIVGYILAGVAVGPFTGGFTVAHVGSIEELAEVGVALLLFSLGLEVSFRELAPVRAVAVGGAVLQLVLTITFGIGLATALGWPWRPAVWFGAATSLSSTMVALKTLQAQGRLGTLSSRVMLGLLVVQDLAVVPMMIVLPELSNPSASTSGIVLATGRAFGLLAVTVLVATRVAPRFLALVARRNSRELFLLATIALALGVGYAAWSFGLSVPLGAFIAGLVINESEYAHQALSDIAPLRDLFGMLFFVSVGMLLDPAVVGQQLGMLAIGIIAIIVVKSAIFAAVVRLFGYRRIVPLATGLTLFQVGEFAFVLARVGVDQAAIGRDLYGFILNAAVASMALTPMIAALTPRIYARLARNSATEPLEAMNLPDAGLDHHVVVAGAGRVGLTIADGLASAGVPYVLIEIDDRRVQEAHAAGHPIIYGDAGQTVVLEAARVNDARALLVTAPGYPDVRGIVEAARRLQPDLAIVARADGSEAVRDLYAIGVREVASPEFEAATEMTRRALAFLGMPAEHVEQIADAIRRKRYGPNEKRKV